MSATVSAASGVGSALGHKAAGLLVEVNTAHTGEQLDRLAQSVWVLNGAGEITDAEATEIAGAVAARRPDKRPVAATIGKLSTVVAPRLVSRFIPRQRPRSPDREASRRRRRTLGGSSALPDTLRHHYTEGQRAVLCVVAGEVKHHGVCDLPIDRIGALAGVCRTTVQTTLHEARRLGHISVTERPQRGRKSLSNVVRIEAPEWTAWMKRGPTAHRPIGSKTPNLVSPTKITERQRSERKGLSGRESRRNPTLEPPGSPAETSEARRLIA